MTMDSISEGLDLEFGDTPPDDLEIGMVDTAPGALESQALAPPRRARFGDEVPDAPPGRHPTHGGPTFHLAVPHVTKGVKDILAIVAGGAVGGFLIGGPVGAVAGSVFGYLLV
jgi:hypothetical protein